jgi:hypothetical protein
VRVFAENCLGSCLHPEEAPITDNLASAALRAIQAGERVEDSPAVAALSEYLDRIDESIYQIRNRMPNIALRQNILPWVESLDEKLWLARRALTVLRALQNGEDIAPMVGGLKESIGEVRSNPRSVGGKRLAALGEYVYGKVQDVIAEEETQVPEPEPHGFGGAAFAADR